MMRKMGWEMGQALGKQGIGHLEPIAMDVKVDRCGKQQQQQQQLLLPWSIFLFLNRSDYINGQDGSCSSCHDSPYAEGSRCQVSTFSER